MARLSRFLLFTIIGISLLYSSCMTIDPMTSLAIQSYNLGIAHMQLGNTKEAEKAFLYALQEYPEYTDAAYELALLYNKSESYQNALEIVNHFTKDNYEKKDWRLLEAYLLYKTGDTSRALSSYELYLESWPDDELRLEVAKIALNIGQFDVAQDHLLSLFEKGSMSGELLYLLGQFEELTGGDKSLDWYKTAVLEDSGYMPALQELLDAYSEASVDSIEYQELYEILQEGNTNTPDQIPLLLELAKRSFLMDSEEGVAYIREVIELGYDDIDELISIYDSLEEPLSRLYLLMLEQKNIIRIVTLEENNE